MTSVSLRPEPDNDDGIDVRDVRRSVISIKDVQSSQAKATAYATVASAAVAGIADLLSGKQGDFTHNVLYPLLAGLGAGGIVTLGTTPVRRDCRRIIRHFFASAKATERDRAADVLLDAHLDPAAYGYDDRPNAVKEA